MNDAIIGIDVGYGGTKCVLHTGDPAQPERSVCFPSLVAPAELVRFHVAEGAPQDGLILFDTVEGDLFVGELAARQGRAARSPRDRNRVTDPIVGHLADAALARLLPRQATYVRARLVTGLPVDYYRDRDQLVGALRGQHPIVTSQRSLVVDVDEALVVPQPFGSFLALLLDEGGRMHTSAHDLADGRVAVLDVGMFTTDMLLIDALEYIEPGSGSLEVGVSTAIEMLRKVLLDEHRVSYETHQLEVALRRGWVTLHGERRDVDRLAGGPLSSIASSVEARARTLWKIETLDALVLTGGGALALDRWLRPRFASHARVLVAPDVQMANATGFLRYGVRKWT